LLAFLAQKRDFDIIKIILNDIENDYYTYSRQIM